MASGEMIELAAGDYRLLLEPERGGSIARFDWRGEALFRPTCGPSILDTACFPLVPFSNRIAHGVFRWAGRSVKLAPNFPGSDHPHPLHGFGWLSGWEVAAVSSTRAILHHRHAANEWPWDYVAEQAFTLSADGLRHELSLRNLSEAPMPAGLGFHPHFPRDMETRYLGLHTGEWQTSDDCLPLALKEAAQPIDWWNGQPVGSRTVDTVYSGRDRPLTVIWPERALVLTVTPCELLSFTAVFTPVGADYFCLEPVSHATDAINRPDREHAMKQLGNAELLHVDVHYQARDLQL